MSNKETKSADFVKQAGILAAAGMMSRLIGLIYRIPLANILTDEGNGYYSTAYNMYILILLISSYSIPSAMSKILSGKLEKREYKKAQKIFYAGLIYVGVIGLISGFILFFFAKFFIRGEAHRVLQVFAPTVLLFGFLGVLRGYFQAHKSMIQTSVSQIAEQIMNCAVSLTVAFIFMKAFGEPIYGAMGSAIGTGAGVVAALLVMLWAYRINRGVINRRIRRDKSRASESYSQIFKNIFWVVTPIILSTFVYNFSIILNNKLFTDISMGMKGLSEKESYTIYGVFSAKASILSDVPIALATAMSAALIPVVSGAFEAREFKRTVRNIEEAIYITMIFAIPASVGMFILANPIISLIFNTGSELNLATRLLQLMTLSISLYALSTLTNGVLQGIGAVNKPLLNASISLVVQSVVVILLLTQTKLGIYSLPIAFFIYAGLTCILNQLAIKKFLNMKFNFIKFFLVPLFSSGIMGALVYLIYLPLKMMQVHEIITVPICGVFGVGVYLFTMLLTKGITREEIKMIPKGHLVIPILERLRLLP